tara:strand:- start:327 stop:689 length:363 start_codon:yes stop_codon:yes gene_type:complete
MNINDFINNWLRPEVKSLIFQYTVSTPIKSELKKLFNERKYIQYKWVRYEYSWRLQKPLPTFTLYIVNPAKKKQHSELLEEESNGIVYVSNAPHHWVTVSWPSDTTDMSNFNPNCSLVDY